MAKTRAFRMIVHLFMNKLGVDYVDPCSIINLISDLFARIVECNDCE